MKRDALYAFALWLVLTAVALWWAFTANLLPVAAAEEAHIIDNAFRFLLILGMPVATLVLAILFYSVLRFRSGGSLEDGPPMRTNRLITWVWFGATSVLAVYVIINPGLTGLSELNAQRNNEELVVQVEGQQWHWKVTYPQYGLTYDRALQIALPVDTRVKFELTSADVIHSFWIPAFRMKLDAVPGKTSEMYVTPTKTGAFEEDPNMRVQCAELCGTGHPLMQMGVIVLEPDQFKEWVNQADALLTSN